MGGSMSRPVKSNAEKRVGLQVSSSVLFPKPFTTLRDLDDQDPCGRGNVRTSNDFLRIVSEEKVCHGNVTLIFHNTTTASASLFTTIRGETAFGLVQDRFPPTELEKWGNIILHQWLLQ